jgi:hypothetical protein
MANQQGWNQQTPAVQSMLGGALRLSASSGPRRKAPKKQAKAARRVRASGAKRSKRSSAKRKGKFVKGSAAAKAYMASIRPKR